MGKGEKETLAVKAVESKILLIRGHRVMLGHDLAVLYGVETKALVQAVKRNVERFPSDFMFQLTSEETAVVRSQSVTLDASATFSAGERSETAGRGRHRKYPPYAFTQEGVAMLSGVLRGPRAVQVNIEIMRAFVRLRRILQEHADLARKLAALEKRYDMQFKVVFDAIRELMAPPVRTKRPIGFEVKEKRGAYGR